MKKGKTVLVLLIFAFACISSFADVDARKAAHRTAALEPSTSKGKETQVILAYEDLQLDEGYLKQIADSIQKRDNKNRDFDMMYYIRILFLTSDYDNLILPVLQDLQFWPVHGNSENTYNSENHMIMWTSSAYLLKQREGWEMDDLLEERVKHFLDLKKKYGFYEWYAPVYWDFTLQALLNLADFAEDEEIRSDAEIVAKILLEDLLSLTNDKGKFFPVAGRGKVNRYESSSNGLNKTSYLLTGVGEAPTNPSRSSGFLATSDINYEDVAATWSATENFSFKRGHHINENIHYLQDGKTLFPRQERGLFIMSAGGYFHPDIADDVAYTANYYDMATTFDLPIWLANLSSDIGATFSRSSVLSEATFDIYKNEGVTLSSVHNYYGGYAGYQQWPWVAAVDDIAVWTQSGPVTSKWSDRDDTLCNSHLPKVFQDGNVALIMYWPNSEIVSACAFTDQMDTDVALHWKNEDFDEVAYYDRWIIGKRNDSYIAVYRHRTGSKNGWYYSGTNNGRQYWAVVVGNSTTHGSFDDFVKMVEKSSTRESYVWNWSNWAMKYYARVTVDGKSISYDWYDKW